MLLANWAGGWYRSRPSLSSRHTRCAIVYRTAHGVCLLLMAGFQTHIAASTITGVGYGVWGYHCGAPIETCVLAGGLCSVSGMLPDLDSDSGRPVQEISSFAAAVMPM